MIRGGDLDNRQEQGGAMRRARPTAESGPAGIVEADDLAARIASARELRPPRDGMPHCGCCWGRGRDAAIRVIEGLEETPR